MRKPELAEAIAENVELSKEKSAEVLNIILDQIAKAMSQNDTVTLVGFGSFVVRERAARQGKNPQTGETIQIAASRTVAFKPGKQFKESVDDH